MDYFKNSDEMRASQRIRTRDALQSFADIVRLVDHSIESESVVRRSNALARLGEMAENLVQLVDFADSAACELENLPTSEVTQ